MKEDHQKTLLDQLVRQVRWLKESYLWVLNTWVMPTLTNQAHSRPKALDVGCGPGYVMESFNDMFQLTGLDSDKRMVDLALVRGHKVQVGEAQNLPFETDSFDLVYCSFLLLWVADPLKVLTEMKRVATKWVVCLAEPDYGGRIDHPADLEGWGVRLAANLEAEGADPYMGRKLPGLFVACGLEPRVGVYAGSWGPRELTNETEGELRELFRHGDVGLEELKLEPGRRRALAEGTLFSYTPHCYALAKITD